ncbi:MAG: histidine kinase [Candidatus Pseudobacter hemicellulosilyticus]|uniref:Histidine kinase n=1 Tax=Candidatus Pseudobacter hemicellulosilyticus TaxID=3121375 RepID=A0AAJ5WMK5_9BACT|nr:MAG: histidine kinase [Pseudobacter sp.]
MKQRTIGAWLLVLCVPFTSLAQQSKTDSLAALLAKAPEDTTKVHLYWSTGASMLYQNPAAGIFYFKDGLTLAHRLDFLAGLEKCYSGAALCYSFIARYDSAKLYMDTCLVYARKLNNPSRLTLAHLNMADVYQNLQDLKAALRHCDTALEQGERLGNNNGLGRIYSIMTDIHMSQQQYEDAALTTERSMQYFEAANNRQMVGMTLNARADLLMIKKEYRKAIPVLQKALLIADSVADIQNKSVYLLGLAQAYAEVKEYANAMASAQKGLEYAQETGSRKQEAVAHDVFFNIYMNQQRYTEAIPEALLSYAIMKEEKDLIREAHLAMNLALVYEKTGNVKKAYDYLKISKELGDSLALQKYNQEMARLMAGFQVEQKDKEILLLNKDKELQQQKMQQQWLLIIGVSALALLAIVGIGLSINRYRLRQRMKELELRNHIAADLHDEVGSSLSSIHMLSQVAAQQSAADSRQADILGKMSTNARETMEKMGDIVWMIKPGENEGQGLWQRMERFAFEICGSQQINCHISGQEILEDLKLTMQQRKNFYLVFKEALNNAVKYSGSSRVDIRISRHSHQLQLEVQDYGKGFGEKGPGNGGETNGGNGLSNMRNRARELGGELLLDHQPGEGVLITLRFPV